MATRPTKKQKELLSYIEGFIGSAGYGPSYREIMRALNYRSVSTVATHVDNLIKKGHLRKRDKSPRSLEVINAAIEGEGAKNLTEAQSKWLVRQVTTRFETAEKSVPTPAAVDDLYVLVGALHVLGLEDAARAFKQRLIKLAG